MPNVIGVLRPGLQTTVQDAGRLGLAQYGVSASGAADGLSLRLGNLLAGNPENTAALEMTMEGPVLAFHADAWIVLAGSAFDTTLDGVPVPNWAPLPVKRGQTLFCGATKAGARCYLCVRGGIDVPPVLGSASTHLRSGLGGHNGRALRAGDVLRVGSLLPARQAIRQVHPQRALRWLTPDVIRTTSGPQIDWFSGNALEVFCREPYLVTGASDRMGIRLRGPALGLDRGEQLLTEGVSLGAVQAPPDGQPIILFVEHQTTGGYPKIANVIEADLPRIGQLKPNDAVRFRMVTPADARRALEEQEEWIRSMLVPCPG